MSDLSRIEKLKLEKMFAMEGGYVLDFTNNSFNTFILESINIDIYDDKYQDYGISKANRLRAFWHKESNFLVGTLILKMLEYTKEVRLLQGNFFTHSEEIIFNYCEKIGNKYKSDSIVEEIEVLKENLEDVNINYLVKSIKDSINNNEPEVALDRLHTYVIKHFRTLCDKHSIDNNKDEPLNSIFGKYVKYLINTGIIESQMTERILKSSISILDAFNDIRNNKSLAHDNEILNYDESLLIFKNITNTLKFIEVLESKFTKVFDDDELPF